MDHLTIEDLARLVDETPTAEEQALLDANPEYRQELAALKEQSAALGALPELLPPKGDWQVLEAQLRSEGLVRDPGLFTKLGLAHTPSWMKAAAAAVLFLSGAGAGATATTLTTDPVAGSDYASANTVQDAAIAVTAAQENYVNAVTHYQSLRTIEGAPAVGDPVSRLAALEKLVEASQAAVWHNPEDPYLNGILTSAWAERNAMARLVSVSNDNWF
ncbi:MAG: hypothetical protein AAF389_04095 [Gemmatimonadota bacterium]